jgi:small-conductance mechanosensitive channel
MLIKWFTLIGSLVVAGIFYLTYGTYGTANLYRGFQSFVGFAVIYGFFRMILPFLITRHVSDLKTKYHLRKVSYVMYLFVLAVALLSIWVENPQTLLVTYGLIGAGVAVALQDFFKNFVGGIVIFLTSPFNVGDRIEWDETSGDVIDIGLLSTTLMEINEWIQGNQATGRMTMIPNGKILTQSVQNFTKDHDFLWDEIEIPLTYDSDWRKAEQEVEEIIHEETREVGELAERQLKKLGGRYYYMQREMEPVTNIRPTDNWVTLQVRYVTHARGRRTLRTHLFRLVVQHIEQADDIKIASSTIDIIGMPPLRNAADEK